MKMMMMMMKMVMMMMMMMMTMMVRMMMMMMRRRRRRRRRRKRRKRMRPTGGMPKPPLSLPRAPRAAADSRAGVTRDPHVEVGRVIPVGERVAHYFPTPPCRNHL